MKACSVHLDWALVSICVLALLLAGCSSIPPPTETKTRDESPPKPKAHDINGHNGGFFPTSAAKGKVHGQVTASSPELSHRFEIAFDGHFVWVLAIENSAISVPIQHANLTLASPNGTVIHLTYAPGLSDVPQKWWRFDSVPAGNYTVTVELASLQQGAVDLAYEMSWCTDGEVDFFAGPSFGDDTPTACKHREN